jgi:hypothetical protein
MTTRSKASKPGERARDEARPDHHRSFAAGEWEVSDQREPDEKFGKTRSDGGAHPDVDGDGPDVVAEAPESSGMGRGEKPRKPKHHSRR